MRVSSFFAVTLAFSLTASAAVASTLYRYKDEGGRLVMSTTIPPEIVQKGYEILNQSGRVVEVVPPALTAEQIEARDAKKAEAERLRKQAEEQKVVDAKLLKQFGTPADAVNILKRRLDAIDAEVASRNVSITLSKKAIVKNEESAAEFQRNGKKIPERFTRQIDQAQSDIETAENLISDLQVSREELLREYESIISRLVVITGKSAPDYQ